MSSDTHTGTLIADLERSGQRVLAANRMPDRAPDLYARVDEVLLASRIHRNSFAALMLERFMLHLTDARRASRYAAFDDGDRTAWERLEALRDWIMDGPKCVRCGQPRGKHSNLGGFCPTPPGSRLLFLLSRFVEKRCEASVPLSADGCHAIACGKQLLPGAEFCQEHMQ